MRFSCLDEMSEITTLLKEDPMAGWYELKMNDKGQYSFVLKAGNGEVILRSEQYKSKESAMKGIASVQKNSLLEVLEVI